MAVQKAKEVKPLPPVRLRDECKCSFGPNAAVSSLGRYVCPAAIAGVPLALCISAVSAHAPGLMSRRVFEALGEVPDIHEGETHLRALGKTSKLWLFPCGHLALRMDEWPSEGFDWPQQDLPPGAPDAIHPLDFGPSSP